MVKGLTCIECKSILFDTTALINHIEENPTHKYFKQGVGDYVLFVKLLKEVE